MSEEKKGRGRPKGSPNKRTNVVQDTLEQMQCNPIEGLAYVAGKARARMDAASDNKEWHEAASITANCYKELAKYFAPQLKSTEIKAEVITGEDLKDMLPKINGLMDDDEPEFKQEQEKDGNQ